jgi:hypothetical protein
VIAPGLACDFRAQEADPRAQPRALTSHLKKSRSDDMSAADDRDDPPGRFGTQGVRGLIFV